jgi:hypothetical protein
MYGRFTQNYTWRELVERRPVSYGTIPATGTGLAQRALAKKKGPTSCLVRCQNGSAHRFR